MALLTCRDVSFAYEGTTVLTGVDFGVNSGDYLCIVGENGAGKSTLLKGLLHLKKPSQGEILTGDGLKATEIGYLPQQTAAQKDFPASVYEVVLSGRLNSRGFHPWYSKTDKQEVQNNLRLLGIEALRNRCYRDLSGGQQQRVLLARALCATKKLLLLDEPVTGLDPVMTAEFYRLIASLNREQKITIVMVSHDIRGAVEEASHILHLGNRQLFFGTAAEYTKSDLGRRFVGGEAEC
ncbi:MAG TPA: metal ABC transporter ATP-binding protein [Oscillospiraceae bacterium]|nr:metal ABC transporter ATP-binding protein [Oscillospiraceae bacterium]HXK77644.1 metal ABC transporter ATP-binding protein [Oscillospiraceae bacterium]